MKNIQFIVLILLFGVFLGCADIPEETDIEDVIDEIRTEIEQEKEDLCRNGFKDEWEECDFFNFISCSEYDETLIGPASCEKCKWVVSGCDDLDSCRDEHCSGNGTCKESYLFHDIYCDCDEGYDGADCSEEIK